MLKLSHRTSLNQHYILSEREKSAQEIDKDEKYQVYLELINELEKDGKEKIATETRGSIL